MSARYLPSDALRGLSHGVEGEEVGGVDVELGLQVLQSLPAREAERVEGVRESLVCSRVRAVQPRRRGGG